MTVLTCPETWTSGKEPGISTAASSLGAMVSSADCHGRGRGCKITAREPRVQYRFQLRLLPFIRLFHPHHSALCINAYFLYPAAASGQYGPPSVPALRLNPRRIVPYNNPYLLGHVHIRKQVRICPVCHPQKRHGRIRAGRITSVGAGEEVHIHSCPVPPLPDSSRPVQPHFIEVLRLDRGKISDKIISGFHS